MRAPVREVPTTDSLDGQLLTIEDVATLLQVSRQTLFNWRVSGRGPVGLRIGRSLRYRRSAVLEWIDAQEGTRPPAA